MQFYEDSFAALLAASPEVAAELGLTQVGRHRIPHGRWSDVSPAGDAARRALMQKTLAALPAETSVNRDVYEFFLRFAFFGRLRGTECPPLCDYVADHIDGVQTEIITCLTQWHPREDAEGLRARVAAVPAQIDAVIEGLKARTAAGNTMPTCVVTRVLAELASFVESEEQPAPLDDPGMRAAYRKLHAFLSSDYPREERVGLWRMPQGAAYYRFLLKARTTTELSPDEIHELGRVEVARLHAEIEEKLEGVGYGRGAHGAAQGCASVASAGGAGATAPYKSLGQRLNAFSSDAKFKLRGDEVGRRELVDKLDQIIHDTEAGMSRLFGIKPAGRVVTQPVPALQEANRHSAYVPPAADGSRPGIFDVNVSQLIGQGLLNLYTIAYHEAFPGHHVQLTIAQELGRGLPSFRKILVHDAYIEGWAKYAELLPAIEGFNTDPDWNIARCRSELVSTANLMLDTGIHEKRWTREQGVQFLLDTIGCDAGFADYLVDRVIARPAQVCAYKIGMISVLAARRRMEQALGPRFDIKRFHDVVLGNGSVPLTLLDRLVDAEIS